MENIGQSVFEHPYRGNGTEMRLDAALLYVQHIICMSNFYLLIILGFLSCISSKTLCGSSKKPVVGSSVLANNRAAMRLQSTIANKTYIIYIYIYIYIYYILYIWYSPLKDSLK